MEGITEGNVSTQSKQSLTLEDGEGTENGQELLVCLDTPFTYIRHVVMR